MTEQQQPKLRLDPQQFAQEVAKEISADLGRERRDRQSPQEQTKAPSLQPEEPGTPF